MRAIVIFSLMAHKTTHQHLAQPATHTFSHPSPSWPPWANYSAGLPPLPPLWAMGKHPGFEWLSREYPDMLPRATLETSHRAAEPSACTFPPQHSHTHTHTHTRHPQASHFQPPALFTGARKWPGNKCVTAPQQSSATKQGLVDSGEYRDSRLWQQS